MAQLIKLQDYISRYESNIYQYPTQYIRLKKENWNKMMSLYEQGKLEEPELEEESVAEEEKPSKWKRLLQKREEKEAEPPHDLKEEESIPQSIEELKKYFLDGLYPFQMKWASTTLREKSFVDHAYKDDERLKYFLQRIPDTYFLMYDPIVILRQAEMEALPILIGPQGLEIIYYLDIPGGEGVDPASDKSWFVEQNGVRKKILNPMFALNRTESFIKSVWNAYGLDFPVRKVVLAPELSFHHHQEPYMTSYIDLAKYDAWLQEKRQVASPLKHNQLRAADSLLKHCQTTSFKRPEWDEDQGFMEV
ncbi:NERD domain-containing protein [Halobacillus salinus]|uniref:NERD domain-containing protein n=1 Tax=Halobacillus salinus TaxID=192814 RepID=A0A4Z0GT89_9BACI|nr:NERD domain-containing protein [Halobacillus salinus]TGB00696.1 NERD domain-containing protein [Halobacillus salinus]